MSEVMPRLSGEFRVGGLIFIWCDWAVVDPRCQGSFQLLHLSR